MRVVFSLKFPRDEKYQTICTTREGLDLSDIQLDKKIFITNRLMNIGSIAI